MASPYAQLELDRQICFALYAASRAVVRAYGPLLEEAGLTYPQYLTMLVLWEAPDEGLPVGELGHRLHLDSGTLTPLLKRLEALGYVHRRRDPADERRVLVSLTATGTDLRDRVASVPATLLQRAGLELGEAQALRDELTRLTAVLEAAD
jgi:MarR family transcriptional regulator, organic hydroperoxide resistance regulator